MSTTLFLLLIFLHQTIQSLGLSVSENNNVDIICGDDQVIIIESAGWDRDLLSINNYVLSVSNPFVAVVDIMCFYGRYSEVSSLCEGRKECHFIANRELFGNDCAYRMKLNINYHCHSCGNRRRIRGLEDDFPLCKLWRKERLRDPCDRVNKHMSDSENDDCPNIEFVDKHIMRGGFPNSVYGAQRNAQFVAGLRERSFTSRTILQSLFYAPTMAYVGRRYGGSKTECVFHKTATKYDCRKTSGTDLWECTYEGEVIASHYLDTGHYDPTKDYFSLVYNIEYTP